jgi:hypothetical protein
VMGDFAETRGPKKSRASRRKDKSVTSA